MVGGEEDCVVVWVQFSDLYFQDMGDYEIGVVVMVYVGLGVVGVVFEFLSV